MNTTKSLLSSCPSDPIEPPWPPTSEGPHAGAVREPLETVSDQHHTPWVVRAFSTDPLPQINRRVHGVSVEDELAPGPVGLRGSVDVVTAERISRLPWRDTSRYGMMMQLQTPCERACHELLIADGVVDGPLQIKVHSLVHGELPYLRGEHCDVIDVPEKIEDCGLGDSFSPLAEIPRHGAIVRWMLQHSGLPASSFAVWRCRMRFPPVPSCIGASMNHRPVG